MPSLSRSSVTKSADSFGSWKSGPSDGVSIGGVDATETRKPRPSVATSIQASGSMPANSNAARGRTSAKSSSNCRSLILIAELLCHGRSSRMLTKMCQQIVLRYYWPLNFETFASLLVGKLQHPDVHRLGEQAGADVDQG